MKPKFYVVSILMFALAFSAACSKSDSPSGEKTIKSAKAGEMTATLSSATGALKKGDNELMLTFTDATGQPVDVGAASLNIHMAAMGTMAEMNNKATLTTTETPGKYRAQVNLEMGGTWEAQIKYQGAHGTGQTSMTVQAK
ncbi:MAG TPA: FixH family protein [Blastocatellia bacterium]|nr:FixH family protein [Blastocatellia bacterium]